MDEIVDMDCQRYLAMRTAEKAENWTVKRERGFLCAVWNRAIDNTKKTNVVTTPWKTVKPPQCHSRARVISFEEQAAFMSKANPEYQRLMTVLLGTGLRENEFLQLRLADIKNNEIKVRWETAKGQKARVVPLLPEVAQAFKGQGEALKRGVFDRLWTQTDWSVLKTIAAIAERAEIKEHINVHDFRRTFATRCAENGMPMVRLANILGHSSTQTTEQYYVHLKSEDNAKALERVAAGLALNTAVPLAVPQKTESA